MRRKDLMLFGAVVVLGCAGAEAGDEADTEARARELMGVAPAIAAPAVMAAHGAVAAPAVPAAIAAPAVPVPADQVDPKAVPPAKPAVIEPTPAEAVIAAARAAGPAPPPLVEDPPGKEHSTVPEPEGPVEPAPGSAKTVEPIPSDWRAPGLQPWKAGPELVNSRVAGMPEPGRVEADTSNWAAGPLVVPSDSELDAEGTPGTEDLKPLHVAEQLAMDFPWGKGNDGNWQGTGSPDPVPLRSVSDQEIIAAATDTRDEPEQKNRRLTALVSLGRRKLPVAISILGNALNDRDVMVRHLALSGLMEHGGPSALPMMWIAIGDAHPEIRGLAIWAISLYGTREATKAIDAGLADPDPSVQGMAVLATTSLRDMKKLWEVLEVAAASDEQRLYQEAAYVLTNLESRKAMELLAETLRDSKGRLKRQTFAHALKTARRNHPHLLVAGAAAGR